MSHRLKLVVRGAVQGVGFRPFIYRLAGELGLTGWVNNSSQGVFIECEGAKPALESFLLRVEADKPPRSFIQSLESSWLDPVGYPAFEIRPSEAGGSKTALVLPDIATCAECRSEVFDPNNRRYFYPFTNCTNCGPRFSIIEALPYDRPSTAMKRFTMCSLCQAEYDEPRDRRFHAQPNACPNCGPQLEVWDGQGKVVSAGASERNETALRLAADALRSGRIVAVKGLGGFHLMVTAHDDQAVRRLRELKHREEKPFALMFPSLEGMKAVCEVSPLEERLLCAPESPIVLLRRLHAPTAARDSLPSSSVAPGNPNLGVILPYTPLHHLLLSLLGFPVVATSGNLSDEPICTDEREARERLGGIADLFLVHNRPIVRHVDDSIVRVVMGRELVLRRARGYAPLPVQVLKSGVGTQAPPSGNPPSVLAVGAHLKNTIALSVGQQAFISQHIGDLETDQAYEAFRRVIGDFEKLYETQPAIIAADAHPDYLSTKFARDLAARAPIPQAGASVPAPVSVPQLISVQHHLAHVFSCMAENELACPVLGVSWDGTGYGLDGTVWGGEFFLVTETVCERVAHFRQFRLPGGEQAVKQPRRTALGLLYEMFGDAVFGMTELAPVRAFSPTELAALKTMLARRLNSPLTSSVGRLFDAVAALAGLREQVRFEGQAAMELEFALGDPQTNTAYEFTIGTVPAPRGTQSPVNAERSALSSPPSALVVDWAPAVRDVLADLKRDVPVSEVSAKFHRGLVEAILLVARRSGERRVVLTGGCFQNRYLTERAVERLQAEGFRPYWHQRVPPNDGGIALGQVVAALRRSEG